MSRVSSFGHSQSMIQGLIRNQGRVFLAQEQVNTGKKTSEFRGLAGDTLSILGARALNTRTATYMKVIQSVRGRFSVNEVHLQAMVEEAQDYRQAILRTIADQEAILMDELLEGTYSFIASSLNASVSGVHIFAGSKTDIPPITELSVAGLQSLPTSDDVFANDQIKAAARVADSVEIEYGLLAKDIGSEVFASIRRVADFHTGGSGPLDGKLTLVQRTFLEAELAQIDSAIDQILSAQVANATRSNRVDTLESQHVDQKIFLETFIGDVEDVNLAEAISRLNNDQIALEASFAVVGRLSQLNLVNFI